MRETLSITVNGADRSHEVEPRMFLVHYLRDVLGLTGTNIGCDTSQCGACTVLALQADGSDVTTIEGLATNGKLHPLQEAFWEYHGLQCGYCTPGMIMTAVELLKRKPKASEEDIRAGLEGNVCRCTGYQKIVQSIAAVAVGKKGGA